jgi:hypothetical protein
VSTDERPGKATRFQPGPANPGSAESRANGSGAGRAPGTPNVKTAVLEAFKEAGGKDWLVKLARSKKHKGLFATLLAKTIPQEVVGKDGGPIEMHVLAVARDGLQKLDDAELVEFKRMLVKMGVYDLVVPAANDATSQGLLPAPVPAAA